MEALEVDHPRDWWPRTCEAMKRDPLVELLRGTVVADEMWIGADNSNRHADKRKAGTGPGTTDKQPLLALVDFETRELRSRVVVDVTARSLSSVIADEVEVRRQNSGRTARLPTRRSVRR